MADVVEIETRLRNARKAERDARGVARGIDSIGSASRRAATATGFLKKHTETARSSLSGLGGAARTGALGITSLVTATAAFSARAGLNFNATMEQNRVAFTQFLGGAKAANKELKTLYEIAKTTPFEFADVTLATRKMLAMGFGVEAANRQLRIIADTASGLALDQGGIDRLVLVLGQIKSKDKLFTEELRQIQELGAVDMGQLAKDLKLSREELGNVGEEGVRGKKAIAALNKQWQKNFGGMSLKQAKTFTGQISTLKDNTNQMLGMITKPAFKGLRDTLFPKLNKSAESVGAIFKRDLSFGDKLKGTGKVLERQFGPEVRKFESWWKREHVGEKIVDGISDGIETAAPALADAAAETAPKAVSAFVNAWLNAGPWGKLISGAWVAKKLGIGKGVLAALSSLGGGGRKGGLGGAVGSAKPIPVWVVNHGKMPPGGPGGGGKMPKWLPWLGRGGAYGGAAAALGFGGFKAAEAMGRWFGTGRQPQRVLREDRAQARRNGVQLDSQGFRQRGTSAIHPFERPAGPVKRDVPQNDFAARVIRDGINRPNVFQVHLDGRVIAEVVDKQAKKDANRR